jgi:1,4-dihydroxy-2-naphthoate octaprenyltransferase
MKQKMTFFTFISAYRIIYAIPFVLASLTGVVRGYISTLDLPLSLLILWEVFWLAMFVNLSNDYFDYLSGANRHRFSIDEEKKKHIYQNVLNAKVYWQGNLFDLGYLSRKQGQVLLGLILLILLISAYPLVLFKGMIILLVGAIGLFISFFYTAPPFNLGAKGLGEVSVFVSFAMISYFSAFVIMGFHSGEMFIFSLMVGLSGFLMRLADELTGYDAHLISNEKDLSVRWGAPYTIKLIQAMMGILYTLPIFSVLIYHQWKFCIPLLTLPIAFKINKIYQDEKDDYRILRAVPEMLKLSVGNSVLIFVTWIFVFFLR